jgi:precorrin-6Y C5,15-methyltransferase (decarboxylating)
MDKLDIRVICGISCVSWFAARAGIPWQDWKILSSHGRFCNVIGEVRRHVRCFVLLCGAEDLRRTGALLLNAQQEGNLGLLRLIYGYELSRPGEEIRECSAAELTQVSREGLYVLFIENLLFQRFPVLPGLPDSAFLRGRAPMTSSEIRALSLCKLQPGPKPLIWDVGAGTGSVSVEAALACPGGRVWSIEYKKAALELLKENRDRFCLQNMEIVEGRAPEALKDLPVPTHVFIGGSGGEIGQILLKVFCKNPGARVVVNCITSETLAALQTALKRLPVQDVECIQVSVHREEMLGSYHYLRGMNPVFIISFEGSGTWYAADHAAAEQQRT